MKKQFVVTDNEVNMRLDKLVTLKDDHISRQTVQSLIKNEAVFVNGVIKKANYKCKRHDVIEYEIQNELEREPIKAENIPLEIMYEDKYLAIINKPKGMIVHPTESIRSGTLVNALLHHFDELSTLSGEERPGIVHRLDQDTSGLMIIAKTNEAHERLKLQFQARTVKRIYEALVGGHLKNSKGIIQAPIGRHPKKRLQMAVMSGGREAETHFEVIEYLQNASIVKCQLITGRTHQIRVHMQYIGHPIINDKVYGTKRQKVAGGQVLYAKEIGFHHPTTDEWMEFEIDRSAYFNSLISMYT